jgi:hypothetical protein
VATILDSIPLVGPTLPAHIPIETRERPTIDAVNNLIKEWQNERIRAELQSTLSTINNVRNPSELGTLVDYLTRCPKERSSFIITGPGFSDSVSFERRIQTPCGELERGTKVVQDIIDFSASMTERILNLPEGKAKETALRVNEFPRGWQAALEQIKTQSDDDSRDEAMRLVRRIGLHYEVTRIRVEAENFRYNPVSSLAFNGNPFFLIEKAASKIKDELMRHPAKLDPDTVRHVTDTYRDDMVRRVIESPDPEGEMRCQELLSYGFRNQQGGIGSLLAMRKVSVREVTHLAKKQDAVAWTADETQSYPTTNEIIVETTPLVLCAESFEDTERLRSFSAEIETIWSGIVDPRRKMRDITDDELHRTAPALLAAVEDYYPGVSDILAGVASQLTFAPVKEWPAAMQIANFIGLFEELREELSTMDREGRQRVAEWLSALTAPQEQTTLIDLAETLPVWTAVGSAPAQATPVLGDLLALAESNPVFYRGSKSTLHAAFTLLTPQGVETVEQLIEERLLAVDGVTPSSVLAMNTRSVEDIRKFINQQVDAIPPKATTREVEKRGLLRLYNFENPDADWNAATALATSSPLWAKLVD